MAQGSGPASVKVGAGAGPGTGGFPSCALGVCGAERWRWVRQPLQGRPREGSSGKQALTGAPYTFSAPVTNGWRRLDLSTSPGDSRLPQPLRYLALGVWGAGFAGVFPGHPPKSTDGPWSGTPPRCVGRGGVLENLKFSTLPRLRLYSGCGAAAQVAGGLDPPPYSPSSGW